MMILGQMYALKIESHVSCVCDKFKVQVESRQLFNDHEVHRNLLACPYSLIFNVFSTQYFLHVVKVVNLNKLVTGKKYCVITRLFSC